MPIDEEQPKKGSLRGLKNPDNKMSPEQASQRFQNMAKSVIRFQEIKKENKKLQEQAKQLEKKYTDLANQQSSCSNQSWLTQSTPNLSELQ